MTIAERVDALIGAAGMAATYTRNVDGSYDTTNLKPGRTATSYTVTASIKDYKPNEISGGIVAGDRKCHIAAQQLSFTPARGDSITIQGKLYRVENCNTLGAKGETTTYVLQVRG